MPRILRAAPQFLVADLARSLECYVDGLGFDQRIGYEDFYASVERGGAEIHLKCADPAAAERSRRQREQHLDACIEVEALDDLVAEFAARGRQPARALMTHPWGARDVQFHDSDGYVLCFAESLAGTEPRREVTA